MSKNTTYKVAVVGGGVAGLATAVNLLDQAAAAGQSLAVSVFEKETEPGGNLRTLRRDGYQLEWGPNGFLNNEPATLRLVTRLNLDGELERSSDAARRRFLLIGGRLQEIPTSPGAFVKSGMLTPGAKIRMVGELFVPPRRDLGQAADKPETDETIAQFGTRRLGQNFTDVMLDPMVKGVFGGEATQLSLAAAFPRMVELEKDHGGLFKAMIALARKRKKKTDAGPSGTLHSFRHGMAALINALAEEIRNDPRGTLITGAPVDTVTRDGDGWSVTADNKVRGPFDVLIHAAPAHAAARQLGPLSEVFSTQLGRIPFAPMAVVALGFDRSQVAHDLDGFGMLVPSREKRDLLGALWTSSIFTHRAPGGRVLMRCMAGGAGNPSIMDLDDTDLTNVILGELRPLFGIKGPPEMVQIIRHQRAIAQYVPGHLAGLKALDHELAKFPGLFLTGSSYKGISVNSCLKEAEAVAEQVLGHLAGSNPVPAKETQP